MKRTDNPELKRRILQHLADLYKIGEVREANHLSSYVTCRTKSFLDHQQATEPTEEEVMLFALGYGLQDVITPKDASAPVIEKHGILYRPDMILSARLNEIKTTRKSAKYHYMEDSVPETWLIYMMGGCYMMEKDEYDLIILYMLGDYSPPFPQLYADTFQFDKEELEKNWNLILANKEVLDTAIEDEVPPEPYKHCFEFECRYCRHQLICQHLVKAMGVKMEEEQLKEDKELWQ